MKDKGRDGRERVTFTPPSVDDVRNRRPERPSVFSFDPSANRHAQELHQRYIDEQAQSESQPTAQAFDPTQVNQMPTQSVPGNPNMPPINIYLNPPNTVQQPAPMPVQSPIQEMTQAWIMSMMQNSMQQSQGRRELVSGRDYYDDGDEDEFGQLNSVVGRSRSYQPEQGYVIDSRPNRLGRKKKIIIGCGLALVAIVCTGAWLKPVVQKAFSGVSGGDVTVSADCETGYAMPFSAQFTAYPPDPKNPNMALHSPNIASVLRANIAACVSADHPLKVSKDQTGKKLVVDLSSSHFRIGTIGKVDQAATTPPTALDKADQFPYLNDVAPVPEKDPAKTVANLLQYAAADYLLTNVDATDKGNKINDPVLYDAYKKSLQAKARAAYQMPENTVVDFVNDPNLKQNQTNLDTSVQRSLGKLTSMHVMDIGLNNDGEKKLVIVKQPQITPFSSLKI